MPDQVGHDEGAAGRKLRHRRPSKQDGRLQFGRCGRLWGKALLAPDCCSQPKGMGGGGTEPKPLRKLKPAHPCARKRSGGQGESSVVVNGFGRAE